MKPCSGAALWGLTSALCQVSQCYSTRGLCLALVAYCMGLASIHEHVVAFCKAVQRCCPVGSYIRPVPG